eukprot:32850-Eustigmatos_ZCMA.PRE.1
MIDMNGRCLIQLEHKSLGRDAEDGSNPVQPPAWRTSYEVSDLEYRLISSHFVEPLLVRRIRTSIHSGVIAINIVIIIDTIIITKISLSTPSSTYGLS